MNKYKIILNSARCRKCNDVITSKHRHDFVWCSCGTIFVDGGNDYIRCGGDLDFFEDLSVEEEVKPDVN